MRQDEHDDYIASGRRKRLLWIVLVHLLIVVAFFTATFYLGNFE